MSKILKQDGACFQLKADFFPMTVLKLNHFDPQIIAKELKQTTIAAPNYFKNTPLIIDVKDWGESYSNLDIEGLCKVLRDQQIIPIGVRGLPSKQTAIATDHGLAIINPPKKAKEEQQPSLATKQKNSTAPTKTKQANLVTNSKIITKPIRAGTQVYAKGGDLVVLAAVNAGGECLADGNIHIYGPLRGRALAGASGKQDARIFCSTLDAELVSIAGQYLAHENIKSPSSTNMVQIYLHNDKLKIDTV